MPNALKKNSNADVMRLRLKSFDVSKRPRKSWRPKCLKNWKDVNKSKLKKLDVER